MLSIRRICAAFESIQTECDSFDLRTHTHEIHYHLECSFKTMTQASEKNESEDCRDDDFRLRERERKGRRRVLDQTRLQRATG